MTDESLLQRLRRLDVCAISDALDQLKLPSAVTGIGPRTARRRIAGEVVTVRLAAGPAPLDAKPRHLCTTAIEAAPVGGVVVVEQRSGLDASGWGGILSNAAQTRGLSGVIVEGPARDIDEAADLGFAVYARGQTARTARGRIHEAETGGEIQVGDVKVHNGDFVVADSSGIAFIPADQLEALLCAAERIVQREAAMTKAVLAGELVSQVMGGAYEHMLSHKD